MQTGNDFKVAALPETVSETLVDLEQAASAPLTRAPLLPPVTSLVELDRCLVIHTNGGCLTDQT